MGRPVEVSIHDPDAGTTETVKLGDGPGGWIVLCGAGCKVAHEQHYSNGTVILTIKPAARAGQGDGAGGCE